MSCLELNTSGRDLVKGFLVTAHQLLNYSSQLSIGLPKVKHALEIKDILESGPVFRSRKLHGLRAGQMRVSEITQIWGPEAELLTKFGGS